MDTCAPSRKTPKRSLSLIDRIMPKLLVLLALPMSVLGDPSSHTSSSNPHKQVPTRFPNRPLPLPPPPPPQNNAAEVIQVVETEVWDGERWIGPHGSRWTTTDGRSSVSPADIEAPANGLFEGDWKIVLGDERDTYGWSYVYYYMSRQRPKRHRIWLRTVQFKTTTAKAIPSRPSTFRNLQSKSANLRLPSLATLLASPPGRVLRAIPARTQRLPAILQPILQMAKDDWNFKGFGFSFYKSFLSSSIGFSFRIPLTANWDLWDRHPELPRLSLSVSFYYPFTAGVFLGFSVNVEWVKWCVSQGCVFLRHVIALGFLSLARGLVLAGSALAFPVTRQLYQLPESKTLLPPLDSTFREQPIYGTTLQERIGVTHSWRISAKRGYEFRRSVWHLYLPTLLSLLQHADRIQQSCQGVWQKHVNPNTAGLVPQAVRRRRGSKSSSRSSSQQSSSVSSQMKRGGTVSLLDYAQNAKWTEWWLQRKIGSLGVSTGYPVPDKPHFSCSSVLSLSGFYFRPDTIGGGGGGTGSGTANTEASPASTTAPMLVAESQKDLVAEALTSSSLRKTTTTSSGSTNTQGEATSASSARRKVDVIGSSASKTAMA